MSKSTDQEDIATFRAIAQDCAVWWIQEQARLSIKWDAKDITVTRVEKFRKVLGDIKGSLNMSIAPGKTCRLHFHIQAVRQPDRDCIVYPPSGFQMDRKTEQKYWLGDKRVEVKDLSQKALLDLYVKHYS